MIEFDDATFRNLCATREEIRAAGGECFPLQSHTRRTEGINKMVDTAPGKGSIFKITIPATLAITAGRVREESTFRTDDNFQEEAGE